MIFLETSYLITHYARQDFDIKSKPIVGTFAR